VNQFPKVCSKCKKPHSLKSWAGLKCIGVMPVEAGADPVTEPAYQLEMRNCSCGTTLAIEVMNDGVVVQP